MASAQRLGDANRWRPAPTSEAAVTWADASITESPLALTLTEADVQAILLIRSAIDHTDVVARAITRRDPFLPHSISRVALEHALRALYLIEPGLTPAQRVERRLDDLLHAVAETERQRTGLLKWGLLASLEPDPMEKELDQIEARASALHLTITITRRGRRVSEHGRPSTIALAEKYLSGPYGGIAEFLIRGHGASVHGVETAFLGATTDQYDPTTGINLPVPILADTPSLAFMLLNVPLALGRAFRDLASQFGWSGKGKPWREWERQQARLVSTWAEAIGAEGDDDG